MSSTTAALLGVRRRRTPWRERFATVADRLVLAYGVPRLGNFLDPVKEIFYILLSAKTTDAQYRQTHRRLMSKFPRLSDLASASSEAVRGCIESGGLAGKKAGQIVRVARELVTAGGHNPSRYLRTLDATALYDFISELPGMGPKSALCVAMYSLNIDVFPVDVNVQRIAERMGAIKKGLKHYQATRQLAAIVPDRRCRELHIAMVVHGRTVCLPRTPQCEKCCLIDLCKLGRRRMAVKVGEGFEQQSKNAE